MRFASLIAGISAIRQLLDRGPDASPIHSDNLRKRFLPESHPGHRS